MFQDGARSSRAARCSRDAGGAGPGRPGGVPRPERPDRVRARQRDLPHEQRRLGRREAAHRRRGDPGPVVSADGRFVAFAYDRNIHVINTDGTGERPVTSEGANDQSPAISPDGRRVAFLRASGDSDIFVANIDGSGVTNLTNDPEGSETDVAWSPDGSRIAYTRTGCTRGTNEGGVCIYVMNADGSNQTLLTAEDTYPECPENAPGYAHRRHSEQPSWSPDGSRIAYAGYWNTCKPSGGGGDIWVMNADGSGKYRLMDDTAVDRQPHGRRTAGRSPSSPTASTPRTRRTPTSSPCRPPIGRSCSSRTGSSPRTRLGPGGLARSRATART